MQTIKVRLSIPSSTHPDAMNLLYGELVGLKDALSDTDAGLVVLAIPENGRDAESRVSISVAIVRRGTFKKARSAMPAWSFRPDGTAIWSQASDERVELAWLEALHRFADLLQGMVPVEIEWNAPIVEGQAAN